MWFQEDYFEFDSIAGMQTDSLIVTDNHSDTSDDETDDENLSKAESLGEEVYSILNLSIKILETYHI